MPMVIDRLGSSTVITGSGRGSSGSAIVSPRLMFSMPETATNSPGPAESTSTRSWFSVTNTEPVRAETIVPSALHQATGWFFLIVPDTTRHSARRPTNGLESRLVTQARSGASGSWLGGGR